MVFECPIAHPTQFNLEQQRHADIIISSEDTKLMVIEKVLASKLFTGACWTEGYEWRSPQFLLVVHGVTAIWLQSLQWCDSAASLLMIRSPRNIHLTLSQWNPGILWLPSTGFPSWICKVPTFSLCEERFYQSLVIDLMIAPLSLCVLKIFGSQAAMRYSVAFFVTAAKNMLTTKCQDCVNGASLKQIKMVNPDPFVQFDMKEMFLDALAPAGAELLPHGKSASAIRVLQPHDHGVDYDFFQLIVILGDGQVAQNMQFLTAICRFRFSHRVKMLSDWLPIGGQNGSICELLGRNLSLTEDEKMHKIDARAYRLIIGLNDLSEPWDPGIASIYASAVLVCVKARRSQCRSGATPYCNLITPLLGASNVLPGR
jgi:hypothetical protein